MQFTPLTERITGSPHGGLEACLLPMITALLLGILRVAALLVPTLLITSLWRARIASLISSLHAPLCYQLHGCLLDTVMPASKKFRRSDDALKASSYVCSI